MYPKDPEISLYTDVCLLVVYPVYTIVHAVENIKYPCIHMSVYWSCTPVYTIVPCCGKYQISLVVI